jgi:phytoene dehydrogenase-like protein
LDAAVKAAAGEAVSLEASPKSARAVMGEFLRDEVLTDMLLLPLMYYGSAQERDMEWGQFCIMWQALFHEGFARPFEGVRRIVRALTEKYREAGGERRMQCGVARLRVKEGRVREILLDDGAVLTADVVVSSAGLVETRRLCDDQPADAGAEVLGKLSFVETITLFAGQPRELGWEETIVFFNDAERLTYARPEGLVDPRSGVICLPNNYQYSGGRELAEGILRVTALANYERWMALSRAGEAAEAYAVEKWKWREVLLGEALKFLPKSPEHDLRSRITGHDMFTPRTVVHFTGHLGGAIYGASRKARDGRTHLENLFVCGTDQGFLGITGAMLSGITVANAWVLRERGKE